MGKSVVVGSSYQFLGIAVRTALTVFSTAILARLLAPEDFGCVAMATVVTEFAAMMGSFGFANVLIQRKRVSRLQLDTMFWAALGVGAALTVFVLAVSPLVDKIFGEPRLRLLLPVLSVNFVINSLTAVPWALNARLMRFHIDFFVNLGVIVLRMSAAIAAAYAGLGMWALVIGALVGSTAMVTLIYSNMPYRPRLRFDRGFLAQNWGTGSSYLGNSLLYYASTNLDLMLIGRGLGAASLGLYQNARSLTDEIRARIAIPLQQVLFPAFAALQDDRARYQALVMRAGRALAAVVVPIGVGVSANAAELVAVLYGAKWAAMAPVMSAFGLSAALRASTAMASPLFNAHNRVDLSLRYNIVGTLLVAVGVVAGLNWGVQGASIGMSLASAYSIVPLYAAFKLTQLSGRHLASILAPPFLATLPMWLTTAAARHLAWSDHPGQLLAAHVIGGATIYLLTLHLLQPHYLADLRQLLGALRRR